LKNRFKKKNTQLPKMYKNNSRDSSKIKSCSPFQLSCNLTGMKPVIGYYSYSERYQQGEETTVARRSHIPKLY